MIGECSIIVYVRNGVERGLYGLSYELPRCGELNETSACVRYMYL